MTKKAEKASLLWIDPDMRGVAHVHDRILDVSAIARDW